VSAENSYIEILNDFC